MGGRQTPSSHSSTELPSPGLSEAPRQGHGPSGAARELRLRRLLPPRQQIQSWRITEWNKTQQCNQISRRLVHLKPEQTGLAQEVVARPLRATSCLGSPARVFEKALGELSTAHPEAHGERGISEQGRAADSLRSGEVKSNCAASTAAINLSVYSHCRPSLPS